MSQKSFSSRESDLYEIKGRAIASKILVLPTPFSPTKIVKPEPLVLPSGIPMVPSGNLNLSLKIRKFSMDTFLINIVTSIVRHNLRGVSNNALIRLVVSHNQYSTSAANRGRSHFLTTKCLVKGDIILAPPLLKNIL